MASSMNNPATGVGKNVVILVHGGASSSWMYKDVVPLLPSDTFTIVTPDLPGHGTAASQRPSTFDSAVETVT